MSLSSGFRVAASAMFAQSLRLNTIASNIANAETTTSPDATPYRSRQVVFRPAIGFSSVAAGVEVASVVESTAPLRRTHRPGHPHADANGFVTQSNVDPVEEMVNMIAASRSYQTNIDVMTTTRQLMQRTLDLAKG